VPNDDGLNFNYFLKSKADGAAKITVADAAGTVVRTLDGPGNAGMNRATWDMTGGRGRPVAPGEYTVTLQVGGQKLVQKARVLAPGHGQ
jgi:flagellar hook assembly protein FlgD